MRIRDYILLGLILLWLVLVLLFIIKKRKAGHCPGCDGCSGTHCGSCGKKQSGKKH